MFHRRALLAASAAALPSLGGFPASSQVAGGVAKMRFAMRGLQPVTTVFIGDNGPYLVIVDTGNAVACSLQRSIAEKLKLQPTGYARIYGATGTDTELGFLAHNVTFGQTLFEKDVTFLGDEHPIAGLDGILPLALFTARPTDMDFTTGEIRIQLSGRVDRTGFRALRSERVRHNNGGFIVEVTVEGAPARLLVDTGAATTVALDPNFVRRHGLWDKHPRYLQHQFGGVTKAVGVARQVRTPEVVLGPYKFKDVVISLSDPRMTTLSEIDGLLGIEMLKRFTLGFDADASTLWVKPNDHLADPYPYDHSGLTEQFERGVCTVVSAAPGSPAEAVGLQPGDRLVGLDTPQKVAAFDGRLQGEPDTAVDFEIERAGARTPIKMVLKDWL